MIKVLKFYADWCEPCKAMSAVIEEIGPIDGIRITNVNIDDNPNLRQQYGVRTIPTFVGLKDNVELDRRIGSSSKESLEEWFDELRNL